MFLLSIYVPFLSLVRLQKIVMSEPDHKMYTQHIGRVDKQIQMLRAILENTHTYPLCN